MRLPQDASGIERLIRNAQDLPEYYVFENKITFKKLDEFEQLLAQSTTERPIQKFLEKNPEILTQWAGGGHGRWLVPQKRLGAEHVTDFIIGERNSAGFTWTAVEIESPTARLFTKGGDPSAKLTHAMRQIFDWQAWLAKNIDYACRDRSEGGLGLRDIRSETPCIIIMGRRKDLSEQTKGLRQQLCLRSGISIMTYDRLIEFARRRCDFWEGR